MGGGYLGNQPTKNEGFTLIELLAVIVILAVIALISSPLIMGTIEKAKVNAYKDTVYGIIKAAENYTAQILLEDNNTYKGETLDLSTENKLAYKGTKPAKGNMTITSSGSISLAIQNGKYCYIKKPNKNNVEVIPNAKECSMRVANNLITNGYGEYGNNTNFSKYIYENGVFSNTANEAIVNTTDEYIPIDPKKRYEIKVSIKTNQPTNRYLIGIAEYDIDKKSILPAYVKYINKKVVMLTKDLKNGDTVVYLDDVSNWLLTEYNPGKADNILNKGFIFWNYKDSTGYVYPEFTYSRNVYFGLYEFSNINQTNHTITLKKPWDKGTYPKGTKLSQSMSGNHYNYGVLDGKLTSEFQTFTNQITGVQTTNIGMSSGFDDTKFRPGTKYIQFMIWDNYSGLKNTKTEIKDIVIQEIAK